jgi:hypothetical protein
MKKNSFEQHVKLLREYASLFETYGAKLTLETKEMTTGSIKWGDNVLLEMEKRGHGIGVHADVGGEKNYNCSKFANDLRKMKDEIDTLQVNVRHVSGNNSFCDWVTSTIDAGFKFTIGTVAYALLSHPIDKRPAEFRNCQTPASCHQPYPPELKDRLHPWRANSGIDKKLLEEWLQRLRPYIDSGKVQWKTLPEMYDAYVSWEKNF